MLIVNFILGLLLLVAGRPLYWLFVAISGFLVGTRLTGMLLTDQPEWLQLVTALVAGGVFALLALVALRLAFAIAGLFAAIYLAAMLGDWLSLSDGALLIMMLIAGIAGALVATVYMDWAIIVLSAFLGSGLVVRSLDLSPIMTTGVFFALVVASVLIQGTIMQRDPERYRRTTRRVRSR